MKNIAAWHESRQVGKERACLQPCTVEVEAEESSVQSQLELPPHELQDTLHGRVIGETLSLKQRTINIATS